MKTERIQIDAANPDAAALQRAAAYLRAGETVAFATETVYGLGANALDAAAVEKIFAAKDRPHWDPLIVHIYDEAMLHQVVAHVPEAAARLMQKFWPGPLTLLLPKHPNLPDAVTAGRSTVGVRMPAHPVALALIAAAGLPIAAPSANRFGHTSPTNAQHVLHDLDGRIAAVVDSGATIVGLESTVLDILATPPVIYRPGAITLEMLREVIGEVVIYTPPTQDAATEPESLPSPGVGIRHYAPRARLLLAQDESHFAHMQQEQKAAGHRVGILLPEGWPLTTNGAIVHPWAAMDDPKAQAHDLFAALRALDDMGADVIVCPLPPSNGIGRAMIDRLQKAAREE